MNERRWVQVGGGDFLKWAEKGQTVEGTWRGSKDGQYGPLGMVDTADGRVNFPLHTALLQRTSLLEEGMIIKIVYNGKKMSKNQREFKDFDLYIDGGEPAAEEIAGSPTSPRPEPKEGDDVPF
jgi:hypothetical protein